MAADIKVRKARGRGTEDFKATKIAVSISRASRGVPMAPGVAEAISRKIENELIERELSIVRSRQIAMMVAEELVKVSQLAFERFAINYSQVDREQEFEPVDKATSQFSLFEDK
jgi:transcriptional regulator NrdR family protein